MSPVWDFSAWIADAYLGGGGCGVGVGVGVGVGGVDSGGTQHEAAVFAGYMITSPQNIACFAYTSFTLYIHFVCTL